MARIEVTIDAIGDVATAKSRFAALALPRPWPRNLGADSCAQDGNALYCLRRDLLFHLAMDTVRPVNLHGRTTTGNSPFLNDTVVPVFARTVLAGTA
ncbi:hypothetical protein Airi02_054380 [Actinoallomurus iriomotensis]|uniref:Uncharacterized protein n=1 Tax=Actinoallomurus iriomotensis TaxID=478107 RepID=A0A9W6S5M0_9ACTN|nr:hypothetical protein Airi02_054380 [Actinoallomurus iriomotensis]